jgi:hypothetical protein
MYEMHLHIISFDIPYPANYGGVIDVFYKVKALSEIGVKVHLHCFEYGRSHESALKKICHEVKYYKRDMSFLRALNKLPYIVCSRISQALIDDLQKDDYPILCEGLHTTSILLDPKMEGRKIYVRAHNVEHDYYNFLAHSEKTIQKRLYYSQEASKLYRYESILNKASGVFAITKKDVEYFMQFYHDVTLLPAFNSFDKVKSKAGFGKYVLYHGKLSVAENLHAAEWLIRNVFTKIDVPCIIAGLDPPEALRKMVDQHQNISLIANPNDVNMRKLLREAHINVMITNQATGVKLKLLNSLYNGRFCLVNDKMLYGTSLSDLCEVANESEGLISQIQRLMEIEFSQQDIKSRVSKLDNLYSNSDNAKILIENIF